MHSHIDVLSLALLFVVSVLVLTWATMPVRSEHVEQPKGKTKLALEILEGVAGTWFTVGETWILLLVRVVATSEPTVTVSKWNLDVRRCDGSEWTKRPSRQQLDRIN